MRNELAIKEGDVADPEYCRGKKPDDFTPPVRKLGPHVASLGMRFYTGKMFPDEYRGQIFIAEHGSWNRSTPIGYRVSLVKLSGSQPSATNRLPKAGCRVAAPGEDRWMCSSCLTARCSFQTTRPG